jgi:hypothetical protein
MFPKLEVVVACHLSHIDISFVPNAKPNRHDLWVPAIMYYLKKVSLNVETRE